MAVVERLIAAEEQRGRLLRIEHRAQLLITSSAQYSGAPSAATRRSNGSGGDEHALVSSKRALLDAVDPDDEGLAAAERLSRRRRRADEVGDREAASLDHLVAQPAHAAGVLDAVRLGEAEVLVDVRAHLVGVEVNGIEPRGEHLGERGLAGARQAHDQDLAYRLNHPRPRLGST